MCVCDGHWNATSSQRASEHRSPLVVWAGATWPTSPSWSPSAALSSLLPSSCVNNSRRSLGLTRSEHGKLRGVEHDEGLLESLPPGGRVEQRKAQSLRLRDLIQANRTFIIKAIAVFLLSKFIYCVRSRQNFEIKSAHLYRRCQKRNSPNYIYVNVLRNKLKRNFSLIIFCMNYWTGNKPSRRASGRSALWFGMLYEKKYKYIFELFLWSFGGHLREFLPNCFISTTVVVQPYSKSRVFISISKSVNITKYLKKICN